MNTSPSYRLASLDLAILFDDSDYARDLWSPPNNPVNRLRPSTQMQILHMLPRRMYVYGQVLHSKRV